jgi:capsular polysaccharide biosynthesis protein
MLDLACSPRRRARLLDASKTYDGGAEVVYTVAAPVGIEPRFGYLVRGRSAIIEDALMGSQCVRINRARYAFSSVPTLRQLATAERRGVVLPGPIISLRHVFGSNYYHAVVDCIGALALVDERADLADMPIVIGDDLRATTVMRAVVDAGLVDPARLIVQHDTWIGSEVSISFVRHEPLSEHSLRRTNAFLLRAAPMLRGPAPDSHLYVRRGTQGAGRQLRNEPELVAELERRHYVTVDPGELAWEQQYRQFRAATHVVAVHGAALTNILFRDPERLSVLELTPPDHDADVFRTMAHELAYRFQRLEGTDRSPGGTRPSFVIDIDRVVSIVDDWERASA